jgi:hypothetical protein
MKLQRLVRIRQNFPNRALPDVAAAVRQEMEAAEWTRPIKPGSRIAIGVGSRGITNMAVIARAMVDFWKSRGAKPFVIPVMGSHGAATAEGQSDVLAHYGTGSGRGDVERRRRQWHHHPGRCLGRHSTRDGTGASDVQ